MKGTIIEFKKEVINVERPLYQRIIREQIGFPHLTDKSTADFREGQQIFEVIQLSYLNKDKERITENYFVNYEDLKLAMPIVEGMVQARTRELQSELAQVREFKERQIDNLERQLQEAKNFWWYRLSHWLKKQGVKIRKYARL